MSGKQFLIILIFTLVTALIWVAADILHSRSKVTIPPEVNQMMEPINPNFDQQVINDL